MKSPLAEKMAPREGFEPPRPRDSGFRIHRNTGLCDLGSAQPSCESDISLFRCSPHMRVTVKHQNQDHVVNIQAPATILDVLKQLGIHASTVLAVYQDTIVPHNSVIEGDLELELVIVSSGG